MRVLFGYAMDNVLFPVWSPYMLCLPCDLLQFVMIFNAVNSRNKQKDWFYNVEALSGFLFYEISH